MSFLRILTSRWTMRLYSTSTLRTCTITRCRGFILQPRSTRRVFYCNRGCPLRRHRVFGGHRAPICYFNVTEPHCDLAVMLTVIQGDPDLFESVSDPFPGGGAHALSSVNPSNGDPNLYVDLDVDTDLSESSSADPTARRFQSVQYGSDHLRLSPADYEALCARTPQKTHFASSTWRCSGGPRRCTL